MEHWFNELCRVDIHKLHSFLLRTSQEIVEELGLYIVSFDRPGYGESDPDPKRTPKSMALDIEALADQLKIGDRFYLISFSMGGQTVWGALRYIPHRYRLNFS